MDKMGNTKKHIKFDVKPVILFLACLIISSIMIVIGAHNGATSNYAQITQREESAVKADVDNIYAELETLRGQLAGITDTTSVEYGNLNSQIIIADARRANLENELFKIQTDFFADMRKDSLLSSLPLMIAGVVVFILGMVSSTIMWYRHYTRNQERAKSLKETKK